MPRNSTSTAGIEIEASSFSVWNCVITFLQILLVSTMLYGAGWNQGSMYNLAPENLFPVQNFKAIAFFFSVWALQSVALSLLLIWAIGKKSYHLCHSWMLSEMLMQVFVVLSAVYFAYRSMLFHTEVVTPKEKNLFTPDHKSIYSHESSNTVSNFNHPFRPPKHLTFLALLHFLIKGFGFWIVGRYMNLLRTHLQRDDSDVEGSNSSSSQQTSRRSRSGARTTSTRQMSPPPPYAVLCKDDLPCYDEALKLCLKDSATTVLTEGPCDNPSFTPEEDAPKDQTKTPLVTA